MSERPMVNVYEGEPEELVYRPMNDAEFAQWELDQGMPPVEPEKAPLERLADHLETLEPGAPVTASELLAIIRPDTMSADAHPTTTEEPGRA